MEPMEQIDPLKRAVWKRDYNCLSISKSTSSLELAEQSESTQKVSRKKDISSPSSPKHLRHSHRKRSKLETSSVLQHFNVSSDE